MAQALVCFILALICLTILPDENLRITRDPYRLKNPLTTYQRIHGAFCLSTTILPNGFKHRLCLTRRQELALTRTHDENAAQWTPGAGGVAPSWGP